METSEAKSKRRFLSCASKYDWKYQSTIFFHDSGLCSEEVNESRYITEILIPLKKHIRTQNPDTPVLVRLQFHLKDEKVKELSTKKQVIVVLYSPVPLKLPMFKIKRGNHLEGTIKTREHKFILNLKQRNVENKFFPKMVKIKTSESHLHRINDFIYSDKEIKQYSILNSSSLPEYERDSPLQF